MIHLFNLKQIYIRSLRRLGLPLRASRRLAFVPENRWAVCVTGSYKTSLRVHKKLHKESTKNFTKKSTKLINLKIFESFISGRW